MDKGVRGHLDDNCVYDLVLGALPPADLAAVHAHIGECGACRELVVEAVKSSTDIDLTTPRVTGSPSLVTAPSPAPPREQVRVVVRDGKLSTLPVRSPAAPEPASPAPIALPPESTHLELAPGMMIADRYRLQTRVGEGGCGVVWSAFHTIMKRTVALKFLKATKPEAVKRFLREARISAGLRHPHIVAVHDVFMTADETPVMVMDLLHGESLGARLRRAGPVPAREAAQLLLPVVGALVAAHAQGVVHRDLKPENVFLVELLGTRPGEPDVEPRVLDFGLAKLTASEGAMASTSKLTRSGVVLGTPYYLAPEQVADAPVIDGAVDVWALGVVLYECLTGRKPFDGRGLPQLFSSITSSTPRPLADAAADVPESLSLLVTRMLEKTPAARPRLDEIGAVLASLSTPPR